MIFDTHAHYDDERFDEDREELLLSLKDKGIGNVVNVGASVASTKKTFEIVKDVYKRQVIKCFDCQICLITHYRDILVYISDFINTDIDMKMIKVVVECASHCVYSVNKRLFIKFGFWDTCGEFISACSAVNDTLAALLFE